MTRFRRSVILLGDELGNSYISDKLSFHSISAVEFQEPNNVNKIEGEEYVQAA